MHQTHEPIKSVSWTLIQRSYHSEWRADLPVEYIASKTAGRPWGLAYYEDGKKKHEIFPDNPYSDYFSDNSPLNRFVIEHYNNYLKKLNEKTEKDWKKSQIIHVKRANQDDYLSLQQKLIGQGFEIIGMDVACGNDMDNLVYLIKYRERA